MFVPYFVYSDGAAALDFLERALGFERVAVAPDENGGVLHAEMRSGDGLIMLGTATDEQREERPWDLPAGRGV